MFDDKQGVYRRLVDSHDTAQLAMMHVRHLEAHKIGP